MNKKQSIHHHILIKQQFCPENQIPFSHFKFQTDEEMDNRQYKLYSLPSLTMVQSDEEQMRNSTTSIPFLFKYKLMKEWMINSITSTPATSIYRLNERKSEQAHIPHAPTLLENAVYNEWQFQALGMGNRTKKGI